MLPSSRRVPIRLRLGIFYALLLVVTVAAVGVFLLATVESGHFQEQDATLRLRAARLEREIEPPQGWLLSKDMVTSSLASFGPMDEFSSPGIYMQVVDADGTILASSANLPGGWLPAGGDVVTGALGGREGFTLARVGTERVRIFAMPVVVQNRILGAVLVGESLHFLDVTLGRLKGLLIAAIFGAGAASIVMGWWLTARALGPITGVTRVARSIAETGRFGQRIQEEPARDEVGELVATFNGMLDRLEKGFRLQQEFLADASHELRGPLMVIRGNMDLLKMGIPETERQECVQEVTEELERMSRLISDLLFLAEIDAREMVERHPIALHEVVRQAWERGFGADGGAHQMELVAGDEATVLGDRFRLEQLVWNLVENALRYTPSGGQVSVSLRNHGEVAELTVADSGIGIPPEQLPHIFDRFYRVDKARSREHGGAGLGLAIAKQVAEAHGGQVRVRSAPGEGTTFTVALPAMKVEKRGM